MKIKITNLAESVLHHYDHGCYAIREGEDETTARIRCACEAVQTETAAKLAGYWCEWERDTDTDTEAGDGCTPWICAAFGPTGEIETAVHGVQLSDDYGDPQSSDRDPYCRCVEAHLYDELNL